MGAESHPLSARSASAARPVAARRLEVRAQKDGVLLTSHGDIDRMEQLRPYVREAVYKNPGIPVGRWARGAIDRVGWPLVEKNLQSQYRQIGATRYHENSQKQAVALERALRERGVDGRVYLGYNFTPPLIHDAVDQMHRDGIQRFVVFNQGAQNSIATMGESIGEVQEAVAGIPGWSPEVLAVKEFNDADFQKLLGDRLIEDATAAFPGAKPEEVSIFLTSHGLPNHLINKGDTAVAGMLASVKVLRARLEALGYQVDHGFLNDDFFPGASWTRPDAEQAAKRLIADSLAGRRVAPKHVLVDGRLSFTVHHRATLFDGNIQAREILETPASQGSKTWSGAQVVLARNFDGDPGLAALYADRVVEAFAGRGRHLERLSS